MQRKLLRLGCTVYVVAALALTGCATVDTRSAGGNTASEPQADAGKVPVPNHPSWRPIPNPDNDLWIKVRNGYQLPEQYGHPIIHEWVEYYLNHDKHRNASLRRARPFLWHVVQAVSERGMPLELALLPIVESGYDASARSYSGAGGLWQFMPPTARDMGLSLDWWYDGRYDVLASTQAALDYLSWLHDMFDGNWLLALTAYNAGPGTVSRALEQARANGQPADFWHLDLPAEPTSYVPKLFALRRLLAHPVHFGIAWPALADQQRTAEVRLPAQIELDIAADMLDISETRLRALNPDVKHSATAPNRGGAGLLVPISKAQPFQLALAQADPAHLVKHQWYRVRRGDTLSGIAHGYGINVASLRRANGLRGNRILVGQRLVVPSQGGMPVESPTKPYTVHPGDTLWRIAHRNGLTVAALRSVNGLHGDALRPGQTLKLPIAAEPTTYEVRSGDTLWAIAHRYHVEIAELREWNRLDGNSVLHPGQTITLSGSAPLPDFYPVQDGDTLWAIAKRFEVQVATLRHLNDMGNNTTIRPGQLLRLQPAG